jgi:hypothetical protein
MQALVERVDLRLQGGDLACQQLQARARILWQALILGIGEDRQQQAETLPPRRRHEPQLGHVCPQRVDGLRALPQQQIAHPVLHQSPLLLGRLERHKAHRRTAHRLADRRRVRRIGLVALHIGLHVPRWHQPNVVAELPELARPVMRPRARFHPNQAWRQLGEGGEHLAAPQLLLQHHLALGTDAVRLKHVLGEIQTDRANLHVDGSLMVIRSTRPPYGTSMPGAGAVHLIRTRS